MTEKKLEDMSESEKKKFWERMNKSLSESFAKDGGTGEMYCYEIIHSKDCSKCGSTRLNHIEGYSNNRYQARELIGWKCLDCGEEFNPYPGLFMTAEELQNFREFCEKPMTC